MMTRMPDDSCCFLRGFFTSGFALCWGADRQDAEKNIVSTTKKDEDFVGHFIIDNDMACEQKMFGGEQNWETVI